MLEMTRPEGRVYALEGTEEKPLAAAYSSQDHARSYKELLLISPVSR